MFKRPISPFLPTDPLGLPAFKANPIVICHHLRRNWKIFVLSFFPKLFIFQTGEVGEDFKWASYRSCGD